MRGPSFTRYTEFCSCSEMIWIQCELSHGTSAIGTRSIRKWTYVASVLVFFLCLFFIHIWKRKALAQVMCSYYRESSVTLSCVQAEATVRISQLISCWLCPYKDFSTSSFDQLIEGCGQRVLTVCPLSKYWPSPLEQSEIHCVWPQLDSSEKSVPFVHGPVLLEGFSPCGNDISSFCYKKKN